MAHPPSSLKVQAAYEGRPLGVGSGVIMGDHGGWECAHCAFCVWSRGWVVGLRSFDMVLEDGWFVWFVWLLLWCGWRRELTTTMGSKREGDVDQRPRQPTSQATLDPTWAQEEFRASRGVALSFWLLSPTVQAFTPHSHCQFPNPFLAPRAPQTPTCILSSNYHHIQLPSHPIATASTLHQDTHETEHLFRWPHCFSLLRCSTLFAFGFKE